MINVGGGDTLVRGTLVIHYSVHRPVAARAGGPRHHFIRYIVFPNVVNSHRETSQVIRMCTDALRGVTTQNKPKTQKRRLTNSLNLCGVEDKIGVC
jgi:hypothetical protein